LCGADIHQPCDTNNSEKANADDQQYGATGPARMPAGCRSRLMKLMPMIGHGIDTKYNDSRMSINSSARGQPIAAG